MKHLSQLSLKVNARCNLHRRLAGTKRGVHFDVVRTKTVFATCSEAYRTILNQKQGEEYCGELEKNYKVVKVLQAGRQLFELENSGAALSGVVFATEYTESSRALLHLKHEDQATPPDIDQTMHGWKRGTFNKTLEPTLFPANSHVAPDSPDVHVLVPRCLVQYSEGTKRDWIVLMSTLE